MPRYDLKTPCRNCPFRNDATRIRFACRQRAEEIEEHAYRNGFPCHMSADLVETDCEIEDGEQNGYVFGDNTQLCVGYVIMHLHDGGSGSPWPGIDNDEEILAKLEKQVDWGAPVFDSVEEFLVANENDEDRAERESVAEAKQVFSSNR